MTKREYLSAKPKFSKGDIDEMVQKPLIAKLAPRESHSKYIVRVSSYFPSL